jgi:GTP-binding protein
MAGDNFVDYVRIFCKSGDGGAGSAHFFRSRSNPRGGPDGGDGGRGGHVILRGNAQLWTLLHLKYTKHVKAGHGERGGDQLKSGAYGEDKILEVPLGTVARDGDSGDFLFEITEDGQTQVLMPGGRGGLGNDHFKSPTNRAPRYAQPGEAGEEAWRILELKLLADVGLVGFPNAGKSTLLSVLSAAKPRIADYPFTTLRPNLGLVSYREDRSFMMADIPGIIEGAHEGKGLGHRFLRHIERNSLLLFMVPVDAKDIRKEYTILVSELEKFNPELLDKPRLLALTKADMLDETMMQQMQALIPKGIPSLFISSVSGYQLAGLKDKIWQMLNSDEHLNP